MANIDRFFNRRYKLSDYKLTKYNETNDKINYRLFKMSFILFMFTIFIVFQLYANYQKSQQIEELRSEISDLKYEQKSLWSWYDKLLMQGTFVMPKNNPTTMKKKEKLYYYFCRECKKAIGRNFKKLRHKSFCEKTGKNTIIKLITKTRI